MWGLLRVQPFSAENSIRFNAKCFCVTLCARDRSFVYCREVLCVAVQPACQTCLDKPETGCGAAVESRVAIATKRRVRTSLQTPAARSTPPFLPSLRHSVHRRLSREGCFVCLPFWCHEQHAERLLTVGIIVLNGHLPGSAETVSLPVRLVIML